MKDDSKAQIYLAANRGHTETDWFRSYTTFNFGGYQNATTKGFGSLYLLTDDTLAGGKSISLTVEGWTQVVLLPTVGTVVYTDSVRNSFSVEAGHSLMVQLAPGTTYQLHNPYDEELINVLQFWFKSNEQDQEVEPTLSAFDLQTQRNTFLSVITNSNPQFLIGKFDGRSESVLKNDSNSGFFFFVIQGAFEIANRLLEARDGLALWDVEEAEMEALSNEAILVAITLPRQ